MPVRLKTRKQLIKKGNILNKLNWPLLAKEAISSHAPRPLPQCECSARDERNGGSRVHVQAHDEKSSPTFGVDPDKGTLSLIEHACFRTYPPADVFSRLFSDFLKSSAVLGRLNNFWKHTKIFDKIFKKGEKK